ncbi:MAG: mycothione reductase [Acidimicrobiales bacterium]
MRTYDLLVLGAGSGNMLPAPELSHLRTAIVESDRFGGTCLNRGCIPSKMFVVAADAVISARHAHRLGVNASVDRVDWRAIRDRVFARIDPLHESAVGFRRANGVDVLLGSARFVEPKVVEIVDGDDAGQRLTAEKIVVSVGSRPAVPDIPGLDTVPYLTSDTIMRLDQVPESLLVLGGGFIAAELGHVFEAFGAKVTIVQRGPRLLMSEDTEISVRFTELAQERFTVLTGSEIAAVERTATGVRALVRTIDGDARPEAWMDADALLVAAGRVPNTDRLEAASAGGLDLDEHGHVLVGADLQTNVPGVWSFGDTANHFQLKHMANAEARVLRHNLLHPSEPHHGPADIAPHAVFTDPQIASIGMTEERAIASGIPHVIGRRAYGDVAYGWALEDTASFVKVIADPVTRLLLGAHIIGPQAALLIQPLLQAMMLGQTVDQIACQVVYIHPALSEVIENALLNLV